MSCLENCGFPMSKLLRVVVFFVCWAIWLPRPASAQDVPTKGSEGGDWDMGVWASGAAGREGSGSFWDARIWSVGVKVLHVIAGEIGPTRVRGRLEYGFDLVPAFVPSKPQRIFGGGFEPIVLRYKLDKPGRFVPYLEWGGGCVITTRNFPAGNTSAFNFTVHAGPGLQVATGRRQGIDVALNYRHYSNANLGATNPSFDGLEIVIGYHWLR